jgi:predicted outer membrane repeat protein
MEGSNTTHEGHLCPCLPLNSRLPKVTDETDVTVCENQCCGSGSGIRDEPPGSYFLDLINHFFGVKILKFFDADPGSGMETVRIRVPGSGMGKSRIRDGKKSDPGSGINISDPQHW